MNFEEDPDLFELDPSKPCYDCDAPTFRHIDLDGRCEECYLSLK